MYASIAHVVNPFFLTRHLKKITFFFVSGGGPEGLMDMEPHHASPKNSTGKKQLENTGIKADGKATNVTTAETAAEASDGPHCSPSSTSRTWWCAALALGSERSKFWSGRVW